MGLLSAYCIYWGLSGLIGIVVFKFILRLSKGFTRHDTITSIVVYLLVGMGFISFVLSLVLLKYPHMIGGY